MIYDILMTLEVCFHGVMVSTSESSGGTYSCCNGDHVCCHLSVLGNLCSKN